MDWTDTRAPKPPRRRYPFWARRDRRRAAQALAGGRTPEQVALINRLPVLEVERLMRNEEFQELLRHYRGIAGLSYEERVRRLAPMALDILEMGLETGDMRVAMFVLHEQKRGRDPAVRVAKRLVERCEAAVDADRPRPERAEPQRRAPVNPVARPGGVWNHCAAGLETPEAAEILALRDLRRLARDGRATLDDLADKLANEAERAGTALGPSGLPAPTPTPTEAEAAIVADAGEAVETLAAEQRARRIARHYHDRPAESMAAAARLEAARRLGRLGTGPPRGMRQ